MKSTIIDPVHRGSWNLYARGGHRSCPARTASGIKRRTQIYFGPKAPKDKTNNWIKTDSNKGFFVLFRFYGPLEGYIDKSWKLSDFEMVELGG
jgi:hypothetical protein